MATYKYLIDYFDKDLAEKSWARESKKEPMSYDDWLSSNGYSECWSLCGKRFDSEAEAIEFMITDFHHTDSRTRRIILMDDNKDDWEMDFTYDSLDYPELEYRADTYYNDNLDNLNGNGEFDNQTNLINAVERTVEMFKEEEG